MQNCPYCQSLQAHTHNLVNVAIQKIQQAHYLFIICHGTSPSPHKCLPRMHACARGYVIGCVCRRRLLAQKWEDLKIYAFMINK